MTEQQIYDKDGLFHNIVKMSTIMKGTYHFLVNGTADINASNITGLELPKERKFPLVACLPPLSDLKPSLQEAQWEPFVFRILFITNVGNAAGGNISDLNANTNTTRETILQKWESMRGVCLSFMAALESVTKKTRGIFRLDDSRPWRFSRFANQQTDKFCGVMIQFNASLAIGCEFIDVPPASVNDIVIPS